MMYFISEGFGSIRSSMDCVCRLVAAQMYEWRFSKCTHTISEVHSFTSLYSYWELEIYIMHVFATGVSVDSDNVGKKCAYSDMSG